MAMSRTLSIVVPVFNEAEALPELFSRLEHAARTITDRYEIVLIDDGSDINDYMELIQSGCFGQSAETEPTTLSGVVTDNAGTPLEGVRVQVGTNTVEGCTDQGGNYSLDIGPSDVGNTKITFDGSGDTCTLVDPTPDILSGQYPTIPNKPIFINGGTDNRFREMSLPERDLTGSVDLRNGGATETAPGVWQLNDDVFYQNSGVSVSISEGCTVTFPDGEDPVLSITRVDPARLPIPMPPNLSSSLFVTYQPGGTEVDCEDDGEIFTSFDNDDGFPDGMGNLTDGPFLAGITNGVFTPLVACNVMDSTTAPPGVVECGPIPLPFDFAWYHTDINPPAPCERTTVAGVVRLNDSPMTPVVGASVSVPGVAPVTTASDGTFSIPNVPAGPNGARCFSNPFSIRASARDGTDFGVSTFVPGVPGGTTNVGDIKFGLSGTVQGSVLKLSSVTPFIVIPLPRAQMDVDTVLTEPECCPTTDTNGNYTVVDVPGGDYIVKTEFRGHLPAPGGGTEFKQLFGSQDGNIGFDGDIQARDFRFTGTGAVRVTATDTFGNPVPFFFFQVQSPGGDLGSGFVAPAESNFASGSNGTGTAGGVPQGECKVTIFDNFETPAGMADCFINEHGEEVEVIFEDLDIGPPPA